MSMVLPCIQFSDAALIDGRQRNIYNKTNTGGKTVAVLPHFWTSAEIDPTTACCWAKPWGPAPLAATSWEAPAHLTKSLRVVLGAVFAVLLIVAALHASLSRVDGNC